MIIVIAVILVCVLTDIDNKIINGIKYRGVSIDTTEQAMSMIDDGNQDAVVWWYESKADAAGNNQERAKVYLDLAMILSDYPGADESHLGDALQYALQAEDLSPSVASAARLSLIYDYLGDAGAAQRYSDILSERMLQTENLPLEK